MTDVVVLGCKNFSAFEAEAVVQRISDKFGAQVHNITCEFTGDRAFDQLVTESLFLPRCQQGDMIFVKRNESNTTSFVHLQLLVTDETGHEMLAKGWLFFYKDTCLMGSHNLSLKKSVDMITNFIRSQNEDVPFAFSPLDPKKIVQDLDKHNIPILDLTFYSKLVNIFIYAKLHPEKVYFMVQTTFNFHKFQFFLRSVPGFGDTVPRNAGWFSYYKGRLILGMTHLTHDEALQTVVKLYKNAS